MLGGLASGHRPHKSTLRALSSCAYRPLRARAYDRRVGVSAKIKIGALAAAVALGGLGALVIVSRGSDEPESRVSLAPTSEVSKKPHPRRLSIGRADRERNTGRGESRSDSAGGAAAPAVVVAPQTQPAIVPEPEDESGPAPAGNGEGESESGDE